MRVELNDVLEMIKKGDIGKPAPDQTEHIRTLKEEIASVQKMLNSKDDNNEYANNASIDQVDGKIQ